MIIYHGSKTMIVNPIKGGSDPNNDYGPSFYLTLDLYSAKSWACKNNTIGVVNKYVVDNKKYEELKVLDLTNKTKFSILNWLAILMHFRKLDSSFIKKNQLAIEWLKKFFINVNEYDVVIGYRADDSYFRFPSSFISNELAFDDLEEIFMLGDLGVQYAFMSQRAIDLLKFEKIIPCDESFLGHYYSIVTKATTTFDEILNRPRNPNKTYIFDLMRNDHE